MTLDVPGLEEPAVGQLISLPVTRPPRLNQLYLRRGRQLAVGRDDEVLASEAFHEGQRAGRGRLDRGDHQRAAQGAADRRRGVLARVCVSDQAGRHAARSRSTSAFLWMEHEALSTAYDMEGAFNDVAISLTHGTSVEDVIHRDRPVAGAVRLPRRVCPQGPVVASAVGERHPRAAHGGADRADDLSVRGGVSAECRADAAHQPAARADRGARRRSATRTCKSPGTT